MCIYAVFNDIGRTGTKLNRPEFKPGLAISLSTLLTIALCAHRNMLFGICFLFACCCFLVVVVFRGCKSRNECNEIYENTRMTKMGSRVVITLILSVPSLLLLTPSPLSVGPVSYSLIDCFDNKINKWVNA